MISTVGAIFCLLVAADLLSRRGLLPWSLSAATCFTGSAGVIVAGQNVPVYYLVAIAILGLAVSGLRLKPLLAADLAARPGLVPLVCFGVWTLLVTAAAPYIFVGTPVLNPRTGIDDAISAPVPLGYNISNFAQSGYLMFGVALVVVLGVARTLSPWLPAAGLATATVLSSARSLLPQSLAENLFDSSPNVSISPETERMRGIFPEPSALGGFSVTAAVFFVMLASRTEGWPRYLSLGLGLWALTNAILSGSGTALMGGLLILAVIGVQALYRAVVGVSRVSVGALVASILALPALVLAGPAIYAGASGLVGNKVDSSSYANRSASDLFSLHLVNETYGLGVGLGANRPSSFIVMLLSATGVLGTALFVSGFLAILLKAIRHRAYQPTAWALVSLVFSKLVAGPDVSDPVMWFLLAVCAHGAWSTARSGPPEFAFPEPRRPTIAAVT